MITDKEITDELRRAYGTVSDSEIAPLSVESRQRIKQMIHEKMEKTAPSKTHSAITVRWIAAAAAALVLFFVTALNSEKVIASISRMFGFVPGTGVVSVEEGDDYYILENSGEKACDDMIEITLNDAFVHGNELELRYTVYLSKITIEDLQDSVNTLSELYNRLGYDKYFTVSPESPRLTPYTTTHLGGIEITPDTVTVTETESLESSRTICISHHYDITDAECGDSFEGTLNVGGVEIQFRLRKLEGDISVQGASGGQMVEVDGVKLLCVPTLRDNILYLDYYACDLGEYKSTSGLRGWYITDTLTVGGQIIEDELDESCIFFSDNTSHVGNRLKYDLSGTAVADEAVITAEGIFVEKEYSGKGIFLDCAPTAEFPICETVSLDGIDVEVAQMCHRSYGEEEGYEPLEHGYLEFRYSAASTDAHRFFIGFTEIIVNGESIEFFSIEPYDIDYVNIVVPLSVPYEEVRSIEFGGVYLMLQDEIEFRVPLKAQ
ncbi:MAG: hypothetical protein E7546_08150 [Ruminococcaceae bacterium]|nr:hypothetical protein [Oscillospiraceae bacterium]